jgi:anti-anti-sigma regulatory factor
MQSSLQVEVERCESHSVIRLQGELNVACAAELKGVLVATMAEGGDLQVDLEGAVAIDVSIMQLLWATRDEAKRMGTDFAVRASEAVGLASRDAGFDLFLGEPV